MRGINVMSTERRVKNAANFSFSTFDLVNILKILKGILNPRCMESHKNLFSFRSRNAVNSKYFHRLD